MFIPFSTLPDDARIWIYQASRNLTGSDLSILTEALTTFTNQWNVHGNPIETSFDIRFDRFIILAANDQVSGCSIDSSVRIMKALGTEVAIDFFDRTQIAFLKDGQVETYPLSKLKEAYENEQWTSESLTFDNQASTLKDLSEKWIIPAKTSWLKRYLRQPV